MNYEKELKKALISDDRILLEKVFEEIYNEYHNLIIYIVSKYINNELDIEEILNDVFFYFFKNIFKTEMTNIKYYLVQSAKNLTINHLKKKKINVVYDEEIVLTKVGSNDSIYNEIINELKEILNEYEINIIVLHDIYNYSFKELANKYNKSYDSIKSTYNRSIKKFKQKGEKHVYR